MPNNNEEKYSSYYHCSRCGTAVRYGQRCNCMVNPTPRDFPIGNIVYQGNLKVNDDGVKITDRQSCIYEFNGEQIRCSPDALKFIDHLLQFEKDHKSANDIMNDMQNRILEMAKKIDHYIENEKMQNELIESLQKFKKMQDEEFHRLTLKLLDTQNLLGAANNDRNYFCTILHCRTAVPDFLSFIYKRLLHTYGENPKVDYMLRLEEITEQLKIAMENFQRDNNG